MNAPDEQSKFVRFLVAWYGLYQIGHIVVNIRGLIQLSQGGIDFPALPPPGGWDLQVIPFFTAMASLDALNAFLSLIYVAGSFRKAAWQNWLGTLTLTISIYAAMLFNLATYQNGAWVGSSLTGYLFINLTFLPVVFLFVLNVAWGARGRHDANRS